MTMYSDDTSVGSSLDLAVCCCDMVLSNCAESYGKLLQIFRYKEGFT